ncbi:MAG: MBL fold metallo-hydrolase [Candidatus Rokuibacteriota bacterium]
MPGAPAHHRDFGFANLNPDFEMPGFFTVQAFRLRLFWRNLTEPPPEFPRAANDGRALRANRGEPTLTWVGHATLLVQVDGLNILTDPHWSERASPVGFAGPRRITPPGLAFEDLPPIHAVVISHDHYDHLDRKTVERLAAIHRPLFLVPLGLKAWFHEIGVTERVEELDWWQSHALEGVTFTATPLQHWSARAPWDRNQRLWTGWAIAGHERRLFFAGDTGYWPQIFQEIGTRLGPFDVAAVAIGGYEPSRMMRFTHTTPEEALRIAGDVRARTFVAIHWATFVMSEEPLDEPPKRLRAEAARLGLPPETVWVMAHGETRSW